MGHLLSIRLIQVTSLQVQKIRLRCFLKTRSWLEAQLKMTFSLCLTTLLITQTILLTFELTSFRKCVRVLCWTQPFLFHLLLSCHRIAFPPGKVLVGFMRALYLGAVPVCSPKMSSEGNFNTYRCLGVFPSKHSHVYPWKTYYARSDAG